MNNTFGSVKKNFKVFALITENSIGAFTRILKICRLKADFKS